MVFFDIHEALSPILTCLETEKPGRALKSAGKCGVDELNWITPYEFIVQYLNIDLVIRSNPDIGLHVWIQNVQFNIACIRYIVLHFRFCLWGFLWSHPRNCISKIKNAEEFPYNTTRNTHTHITCFLIFCFCFCLLFCTIIVKILMSFYYWP